MTTDHDDHGADRTAPTDVGVLQPLLERVAQRLADRAILWRGPGLAGSDVDLLVMDEASPQLGAILVEAGLTPAPGEPGQVVWVGAELPVDVLRSSAWPAYYPSLDGVRSRLEPQDGAPPVASAEDRLLILAADALAGRPLGKLLARIRALLESPGARERLATVAAQEGLSPIAALVASPERLEAEARRGRLPYPRAAAVALRSGAARAALAGRACRRLDAALTNGRVLPRLARRAAGKPLLVTVSGMDGAGKSTAAEAVKRELEASGVAAEVAWMRLGSETQVLNRVAWPAKRLLRRAGPTADPVAAGAPLDSSPESPPAANPGGLVSWGWIAFVASLTIRDCRRAAASRRQGASVVCDRWSTDAIVDLRVRYGRHRLGEAMLRTIAPRPDLAILLQVDASTAAARKPGDQAPRVLRAMERSYAELAGGGRLRTIDARAPLGDVERAVRELSRTALSLPDPSG